MRHFGNNERGVGGSGKRSGRAREGQAGAPSRSGEDGGAARADRRSRDRVWGCPGAILGSPQRGGMAHGRRRRCSGIAGGAAEQTMGAFAECGAAPIVGWRGSDVAARGRGRDLGRFGPDCPAAMAACLSLPRKMQENREIGRLIRAREYALWVPVVRATSLRAISVARRRCPRGVRATRRAPAGHRRARPGRSARRRSGAQ